MIPFNKATRIIFFSVVFYLSMGSHGKAADRILVVHSYHREFTWVQTISQIFTAQFGASGIEYQTFHMDTKRNPGEAWKINAAQKAKQLVRAYKPKVVIAVDDNAQAYFASDYVNKSTIQFVFCGVNADPQIYGYPAANVTGILERSYPAQTLHMLQTIMPGIHGVAVVSDVSTTADLVLPRIRKIAADLKPGIEIILFKQPRTFSAWKKVILDLNQNPRVHALLIPVYHTVRIDGSPKSVAAKKIMQWTLDHTQKPVVGLWPHAVYNGALLAVTVDPREHGRVAARMAKEILGGKKAADIPLRTNQDGYVMVNLRGNEHLVFDVNVDIEQIADQVIK